MFDIRAIRDNPEAFRAAFERKQKGLGEVVSHMLDHDAAVRKAVSDKQEAESARNAKSKEIGKAKASGDEALFERLRNEVADAKSVIETAGEQEEAAREELNKLLYGTPNIPMPDVPEGEDEEGNVEQHQWGTPNALLGGRNNVQDHADLGAGLQNGNWPAAHGLRGGGCDERRTLRCASWPTRSSGPGLGGIHARQANA